MGCPACMTRAAPCVRTWPPPTRKPQSRYGWHWSLCRGQESCCQCAAQCVVRYSGSAAEAWRRAKLSGFCSVNFALSLSTRTHDKAPTEGACPNPHRSFPNGFEMHKAKACSSGGTVARLRDPYHRTPPSLPAFSGHANPE